MVIEPVVSRLEGTAIDTDSFQLQLLPIKDKGRIVSGMGGVALKEEFGLYPGRGRVKGNA